MMIHEPFSQKLKCYWNIVLNIAHTMRPTMRINPRSRKGFWYSPSCKGGANTAPPPDISKSTYAFGPESGLVLDRSKKGEYTKKQNEKLKGSIKIG